MIFNLLLPDNDCVSEKSFTAMELICTAGTATLNAFAVNRSTYVEKESDKIQTLISATTPNWKEQDFGSNQMTLTCQKNVRNMNI